MKVVVIGGTGLIGSKVVAKLTEHGHQAIAASPASGVNTVTGEGLDEVLTGAQVVVDVSNSPSFEDGPAWDFFTTATANLLAAAEGPGSHTMSHCRWSAPTGCSTVATSAPRRCRRSSSRKPASRSRSCARPSSSSSSAASPIRRPTATPCGFRPRPSSRWRPMMSPPLSPAPRSASRRRHPRSRRPGPVSARRTGAHPAAREQRHPPGHHRSAGPLLRRAARRPHPGPRHNATVFPTRFADWLIDNAAAPVR